MDLPSISVRRCIEADSAALALIGSATFLETFAGVLGGSDILSHCEQSHSVALYAQWLKQLGYEVWLAEMEPGAAPVGYMVVAPAQLPLPDACPADLEIKRIYLLDKCRGQGLGKRLVAEAVAYAKQASASRLLLGVYAHNTNAIAFYQRAGFEKLGSRQFNVGGKDYDDNIMGMLL
ncbi:MAG: N-acetyltransferase family protein [Stenotrophomonas geniculata]